MKFLICIFILLSCARKADYEKTGQFGVLSNYDSTVNSVDIIDWKVGPGIKKVVLSQGFLVKLNLPQLKSEDVMRMFEEDQVNSWLIRVVQKKGYGHRRMLGQFYAPIIRSNPRSQKVSAATLKSVFVKIVYAAVAPSKRFENFICPAFGHDRYIDNAEIDREQIQLPNLVMAPGALLQSDPARAEITPMQFNGGTELKGDYQFEMAFYDYENKRIKSNFFTIPYTVKILKENQKLIQGCQGVGIPDRPEERDKIREFKLSR
jgi:hypothetical protein